MNNTWHTRFFELAQHVAKWSKDPSKQVGSVIVNDRKQVLSLGYNGFPRGIEDDSSRLHNRATKRLFVCHAERNALDNAFTSVEGATLYATMHPCNECAKSIIQRGITTVITHNYDRNDTETLAAYHFDVAQDMFKEAGIELLLL
jgi:dCMP deaminase